MDPTDSDWLGCKEDPIEIPEKKLGNVARSWQWRERGVDPPNYASNKTVLENVAEDILVQKTLKIRCCDLPGSPRSTFLMVFSPDGTKVASTHGNHNVYVSELASGKHVRVLQGHPRTPWCIAFHPSHTQLIGSGCLGGQVRVWDIISGGSELWYVPNQTVISSLAFHPRVQLLVVATYNELYFWDWSKPAPFTKVSTNNINEKVRYVAFDALGYKLITGISSWSTSPSPAPPVFEQTPPPRSPQMYTFRHQRREEPDDNPSPNGQDHNNSGTPQDLIVNSYHSLVQRYDSLVRSYQRLFMFRHRISVTPPPPATTDRGTDPMETDPISESTSATGTARGETSNQSLDTDPLSENASVLRSYNDDLSNQSMETDPLLESTSITRPTLEEESDQMMETVPSPEPSSATQTALVDTSNQSLASVPFPNIMRLTRTSARQTSTQCMEREPRGESAYRTRSTRDDISDHYLEIVPSPETSDTHTGSDEISNEFSQYNRGISTSGTSRRVNDSETEGNSSRLLNLDFLSLDNDSPTNHNLSEHFSTFGSRPSAFQPLSESMERVFRTVDQNERTRDPPNPFSSTSGITPPLRSPLQNSETSSNSSRTSIFPGLRSDTLIDLTPRRRRIIPLRLQMSFRNTQRERSTGNNERSSSNISESTNVSENSINERALQPLSSRPSRNSRFDLLTAPEDSQSINESLDLIRDILRDSGSRLVDLITRVSISTLVGVGREENLPNMSDDDDLDDNEGTPPPRPPLSPPPHPPPPPPPPPRRHLSSTSSDSDSDHSLEVNILRTPNSTFREDASNELLDESETNSTLRHEDVRSEERMTQSQSNPTLTENTRNDDRQGLMNSTLRREDLRNEERVSQSETDSTSRGEDARNVERWDRSEISSSNGNVGNGPRGGQSESPSGQPDTINTTPGLGDQIERLVINIDNAGQHENENRNLDGVNASLGNPWINVRHNSANSSSESRRTSETQPSFNSGFNPNRPSTSRDNPWTRQRGTLSEEVFRKVKAGVVELQKHTVQLTDLWLQGNAITVRELRIMWENLRRRIIMIHRENSRPERLSYYSRSLLERCRSLNHMTEVASRTIGRNSRRLEARSRAAREARSRTTVQAQTASTMEAQSGTTVEAQSGTIVAAQSGTTVEAQSGTTVEAQSGTIAAAQSGITVEAQSGTTVEVQSGTIMAAQSGTTLEAQSGTIVEAQSGTIVASQSGTTVEAQSGTTVEAQSGTIVAVQSGTKVEAQSGTTVEAQSGTTVEAQSRTTAEALPRNAATEQTRSNENGNERRSQTRSPLRRSMNVRSQFRRRQPLSLSLYRRRWDSDIRRRAENIAYSRLSNRSRRDYERAIELAATRHEIRMRAMQVLSVMFNSMMTCLEERGLGSLIKTMLRLLKKALALSCLMIMTIRDSVTVDRDVANIHLRLDSVNVIRIQSVDHTGPVNVDDPEDLPNPPPITDTNKVDRSTQNGDDNTTSQQTVSPSTCNEQPSTSATNNTNIQKPPSPPPPTQWSNRLAVRIADANRNTSMTARNRRDIYMESRRLKALHRTNPTAHPLIRKRTFPPITTHRIPPLRVLKNSIYNKYLKAKVQKSRERAQQARERSAQIREAVSMNRNDPIMDEHPQLPPIRVPPDVADEFEQRISLIRRAHMQAVRLRNAARNRFRRLQTIRLYTPSSVREMFSLQHANNPEDHQNLPLALHEPEHGNPRRGSFETIDYRAGLAARSRFPRLPDEAQFHTVFNNVAVPLMHVNDLPTNEVERPQAQRPPTIHEYLQPIILAQNAMVVDDDGNGEGELERGNNGGGGGPEGVGGDPGQRRRVANLLDAGIISGAFPAPSHRIQAWDFTTGDTPDISNSTKNVVVAKCRIHNDASIDISKDGRILVALHPVPRLRTNNHWLGVYSLEWSRLGQCLHTAVLEQSAVSVALSPTARHLAVGLGSRRFSSAPHAPHARNVFALLYRLEPTENSSRTGLVPVQELEQNWEQNGFRSLNCLRWAPQPGQGFVYANNTGQLLIMN